MSQYESSLLPLENLSEMALYFLIVVFAIGGVVLVVLNIFNVRERKYEVGVLTAIGMKKFKVSLQFIFETLVVTFVFIVIGGCIGAVSSVPVTNSLLESQIEAAENVVLSMDIFRELAGQGKCVIIVTHSPEVAKRADQVYEIKK